MSKPNKPSSSRRDQRTSPPSNNTPPNLQSKEAHNPLVGFRVYGFNQRRGFGGCPLGGFNNGLRNLTLPGLGGLNFGGNHRLGTGGNGLVVGDAIAAGNRRRPMAQVQGFIQQQTPLMKPPLHFLPGIQTQSQPLNKEMASKQLRYNSLTTQEQKAQDEWAWEIMRRRGNCPISNHWSRDERRKRYVCVTGSHFITDANLASGGPFELDDDAFQGFLGWKGGRGRTRRGLNFGGGGQDVANRRVFMGLPGPEVSVASHGIPGGAREPHYEGWEETDRRYSNNLNTTKTKSGRRVNPHLVDSKKAERQLRYDSLSETEKHAQDEWAWHMIRLLGACPAGYSWGRDSEKKRYVCYGLNHIITDKNLVRGGPIQVNPEIEYDLNKMHANVKAGRDTRYKAPREEKEKKKEKKLVKKGWFS